MVESQAFTPSAAGVLIPRVIQVAIERDSKLQAIEARHEYNRIYQEILRTQIDALGRSVDRTPEPRDPHWLPDLRSVAHKMWPELAKPSV